MLGRSILFALALAILAPDPARAEDESTIGANCQKFAKRVYSVRDFHEHSRGDEDYLFYILYNVRYLNRITGLDAPATIHCLYFRGKNGSFYLYDIAYNGNMHVPSPRDEQEDEYRDYANALLNQYYDYLNVTRPELTYKEKNALAKEWVGVFNTLEE